ncbi:MAG: hypothetical protein ABWY78_06110 [Microvirga sp.]
MGRIMKEDDLYISGLLDLLNIRFGASQGPREAFGGIPEMAELQREFKIFERGRSLRSCFAVLNLGGFWNTRAKNRWLELIDDLKSYPSDVPGEFGNDRIMNVIVENLESRNPVPMYFKAHDSRGPEGRQVVVTQSSTAQFYVEQDHIVISIPMRPKPGQAAAKAPPALRSGSKAATKTPRKAPGPARKPSGRK